MKKMLLTTTALATLAAGSAFAGGMAKDSDLEIKLGGEFDAQAGFRSQKKEYTKATASGLYRTNVGVNPETANDEVFKRGVTPGNNAVGFDTVAAIHATIKNKTASGLVYGAQVGLQTTTRSTSSAGQNVLDRSYLFMENDMGRVELGSNESAANAMRIGADRLARATGGIDGDWAKYVELNTFASTVYTAPKVRATNFITSPTLVLQSVENGGSPLNQLLKGDEKSRKITYFTPEYNGFQAGVSYIPDTRNSGQDYVKELGVYTQDNVNYGQYWGVTVKNAFAGGISWHGTLDKMHNLKLSVVGEHGKSKGASQLEGVTNGKNFENVRSVVVGAQWNYKEFGLAASYGNQGKSLANKNASSISGSSKFESGHFWTAGASWAQGPWGASVTYMNSKLNKNKMDLVSLGADYEVAPGLMPYAEVTMFDMKQKRDYWAPNASRSSNVTIADGTAVTDAGGNFASSTTYKNKGTAFILGTKINF